MSIGKVCEFDVKTGAWSSYIDRLEMYFTVNSVEEELKLPTLIAVMGDEAYELLVNLSSPVKPSSLNYVEAVDLLRNYLQPIPSVLAERFRFRQRRQRADENISAYMAELNKLARHCKFGDSLSDNLRDQFVCGLKSDVIRQRLFAEDDTLSYASAIKIANALEAAERDSAAVEAKGGTAGVADDTAATAGVFSLRASRGGFRAAAAGRGGRGALHGARGAAGSRTPQGGGTNTNRCSGCGATSHSYGSCRFREYECSRCRRIGHLRRVCPELGDRPGTRRARMNFGEAVEGVSEEEEEEDDPIEEDFHHLCLSDYKPVSLQIYIENKSVHMEIDTGTAVSCISSKMYYKCFNHLALEDSDICLRFYDGSALKPLGLIKPKVRYSGIEKQLELLVVEGGTTSLIGRQWLTELNINIPSFTACNVVTESDSNLGTNIKLLCDRYKEIFDGGLGRYSGGKATLRLRPGAVPVFHRARPLPYALLERVDAELDAMLRAGVIEPVDCSDWASPLVPVNKKDGSLRICADYKATVNPMLLIDRYPLPKIDDLIVRLRGARYFSKIDLSQAYNQIELDDSKKYTVINTHRGLYQYNRLVYGLASSAGVFQRIMCNLMKGVANVEVFLDDIIIGGKDMPEHLQALEAVFDRLYRNGLKLKANKCVFLVDEVEYLGYVLSKDGVRTDPRKIEAITKIPRPTNVSELRSFLGIINFYAKFVRQMSSKLAPLYELLKKDRCWHWSSECERAFNEIKTPLTSTEVLAHYDQDQPLFLTCDASSKGVGGVLTQPLPDGRGERPVAYASRSLNDAERNYSQIHREALAIIFSVNKFHQYLYGRHFTLRTDHKPLVSIFGPLTGIPAMVASRMQRWALILSAYTFKIEYVRTEENGADGFSRLPIHYKQMSRDMPEQTFLHFAEQALLLNHNEISRETSRDPILSKVLSYIRDGWPSECSVLGLQPYVNRKNEMYEELGCVMWGHRLVVPEKCKSRVLCMLHEPHMGIVKSKALARSYVWWAGVDEAVERMCRECDTCAAQADAPPKQMPNSWPFTNRPWTRVHYDFMGPILGKTYLVVVDAMSKWVEVFNMSSTTSGAVIEKMCELYSRWGIPKQIVTDNGPPFNSSHLDEFNKSNGIEHIFTAPYHPASNGLAENAVKSLKRVIKKANYEKRDIGRSLCTFLLHYRNTAHSTTKESPATLLLGRRLRTKLDVLKPDREAITRKSRTRQKKCAGGANRELDVDEDVWYRQFLKGEKWAPGQVLERVGSTDYRIKGREGQIIHRHIEQLKRRSSRQSLTYPLADMNKTPGANTLSEPIPKSPALLPEEARDEQPVEAPASPAAAVAGPVTGGAPSAPASPAFHDALPRVSPPPIRIRPIRQCRLKNLSKI